MKITSAFIFFFNYDANPNSQNNFKKLIIYMSATKSITTLSNFFLITFFLTGCISNPMFPDSNFSPISNRPKWIWYKEGGSQDELAKDNYHCLLNAQQKTYNIQSNMPIINSFHNSSPFGNGFHNNSSFGNGIGFTYTTSHNKQVVTNHVILKACMNAHGWYQREITEPLD